MLPTTGFFKKIDCPYYENSCDRPYCHFKHRKKTHEPVEVAPALPSTEIPTYNPTPKSQLASVRSHIPISYVPDLAIRSERNNLRSMSSYGFGDKQPTYNPTPLSILSTTKVTGSKLTENKDSEDDEDVSNHADFSKYSPTFIQDNTTDDINFEDLETEFDMIDEIISDSGTVDTANEESTEDEKQKNRKNEKPKSSSSKSKHSSSNSKSGSSSKSNDKKHNGKITNSDSKGKSKSDSKSKSGSHSSSKKDTKSDSKLKKEHKSSKSSKDKLDKKEKSIKTDDRKKNGKDKQESKEKRSSRHKESSSDKERHKSKPKERDKAKKSSEKEKKHKPKESASSSKKVDKVKIEKTNDLFNDDCDMSDGYDNGDQIYGDYEDSDLEEDPLAECYKIFTEYKPTEPQIFPEIIKQDPVIPEETVTSITSHTKKRIAHENVEKYTPKVMFTKPKAAPPTAAQIMVNRFKTVRLAQVDDEQANITAEMNRHILKRPSEVSVNNHKKLPKLSSSTAPKVNARSNVSSNKSISKPSTSSSLIDDILSGKSASSKPRRIAPVQNVNSIQRAKAKIEEMAKMKAVNAILNKTSVQSSKGQKRVAHVPEYSVADVPDLLGAERSKLPVNVRTRYLTMILDECMKLYLSKEEAQQRAVNEEYKCYERCAALVTYRNSSMLAINRLRKELQEREMSGLGPIFPGEISSVNKDSTCELKGRKFYNNIKQYILTDEELEQHGYPREGSTFGRAVVKNQRQVPNLHLDEFDRVCSRCSKHYSVDEEGLALYDEECLYHPLKKRTFRGESIYLCCKTGEGAGCVTAPTHVCDRVNPNEKELEGYQTTMPPEHEDDPRSIEVFALDCEMCYTTKGLELTRVTIVNAECKTVYETLVKPLNPIIDYNTRFSGITEEQMNRTATSILQVQANILHLCNSNTILIGHSLESDMKALKIIHSTIIDTSVLFPHKFGLPHKRALRDLAREYLKKIIQNDISGHDSAEDALSCMELVQWKLKEDLKARGIKA